ncbi:hypothetical protein B0T16DRAFT_403100 [Cercophora newfieldiana]|uniref:Uncharacterized protein n=1 Tax=Cercophora newfieldiana TaxID=92897 RepID=A0AA39YE95_9PEZI|nr:hypothetical protein B0T16DRAFT_403100 [Cercophora newfieldiana]
MLALFRLSLAYHWNLAPMAWNPPSRPMFCSVVCDAVLTTPNDFDVIPATQSCQTLTSGIGYHGFHDRSVQMEHAWVSSPSCPNLSYSCCGNIGLTLCAVMTQQRCPHQRDEVCQSAMFQVRYHRGYFEHSPQQRGFNSLHKASIHHGTC